MQEYKKFDVDFGKKIHVFDGLLPMNVRDKAFMFASNSMYRIGWGDSDSEKKRAYKFLYSSFTEDDNNNFGVLPYLLANTVVKDIVGNLQPKNSIINLSTPSNVHTAHAHPEKLVLLYYVNPEWEQSWYGETLFYSEDLKEIKLALPYTPGRVVLFDGSIPHSIRPQSIAADGYRFTYAVSFE